jgi:hypothetical protein
MKYHLPRLTLGVLCASLLFAGATKANETMPRKLAFYTVEKTSCAPSSDDRLADECWAKAPTATTYYEYWKADPAPGKLKSELRMLYDERGVYVRVVNFDEQMDKVRASIVRRDDPSLWTDDCAEFYFDPQANGVGFTVFTVNSLGVQGDRRQLDAAVKLDEWSGNEWRVSTSKNEKSWTIEAFFPWLDLGKKASAGQVWMFNHVRYAWSSGKFIGTTWAPGGNYQSPGNFGYLYFTDGEKLSPEAVGKLLSASAPAPWMLPLDDKILLHPTPEKIELTNAQTLAASQRVALQQALQRTEIEAAQNAAAQKQLSEFKTKAEEITFNDATQALAAMEKMAALQSETDKLYWQLKTDALIASATR